MKQFMERDDPHAHDDYPPLISNERGAAIQPIPEGCVQCPKCLGWGGHNLEIGAYPLHGNPDTPESRHLYANFRSSCDQCNGWGYVLADDAQCIHEFVRHRNVGRCLNEYRCPKCGRTMTVDSSD
jgi:hypothetical protein